MAISDKNTRVMITISKELKAELVEKARAENRTLNNLIVTYILKAIKDG